MKGRGMGMHCEGDMVRSDAGYLLRYSSNCDVEHGLAFSSADDDDATKRARRIESCDGCFLELGVMDIGYLGTLYFHEKQEVLLAKLCHR